MTIPAILSLVLASAVAVQPADVVTRVCDSDTIAIRLKQDRPVAFDVLGIDPKVTRIRRNWNGDFLVTFKDASDTDSALLRVLENGLDRIDSVRCYRASLDTGDRA